MAMSGVKGVNFTIRGTNAAGPAMTQFQRQLGSVRNQMVAVAPVSRSWNKGLSENRRAIQQLGFQMTDFGVQIAGGQNALLAFVQQGGQMLQVFGPMGAILAALLTVFGTLAIVIGKSGIALSELTPLLGVLKDELWIFAEAFRLAFEGIIEIVNLVLNNLDVLATMVAIYFGRMAIAALLASNAFRAVLLSMVVLGPVQGALALATWSVTAAFSALNAVLLRFLPLAVLAAVAWLIVKFIELVQLAGGFGEAMKLLWALVEQVFVSMGLVAVAFFEDTKAGVYSLVGAFLTVQKWIAQAWEAMINIMIDGWNLLMETIGNTSMMGEHFTALSDGIGDVADTFAIKSKEASLKATDAWNQAGVGISDAWNNITKLFENQPSIDIRDWFGGGGKDSKGGGKSPKEVLSEEAKAIKKLFDDISKAIESSLMDGFKAVIKGTKSLKDYAIDVLNTILDKVVEILMMPIFKQIAGNIAGAILGTFGAGVPSFAGGGSTGNGSRSGGMDGKGGFMAMLHPRESVIDHVTGTGGPGAAGVAVTLVVHESPNLVSTIDARAQGAAVQVVRKGLAQYDRKALPRSVNQINADPTKR